MHTIKREKLHAAQSGPLARCIYPFSNYAIINTATGGVLQTNNAWPDAVQQAGWCNEHEMRHGRPQVFVPARVEE